MNINVITKRELWSVVERYEHSNQLNERVSQLML